MRTTLEIEDEVLQAAKEIARRERVSVGHIISRLARKGLKGSIETELLLVRNGVPVLPPRGEVITLERVQQIVDTGAV